MSLRETLIEQGIEPERADAMLDDLTSADEATAQRAYRNTIRAITPVLLQTLRELARAERRK